jgi:transposase
MKQRRRWTVDEKLQALKEASTPGMTVSHVARKYGIAPSMMFRWRRAMADGERERAGMIDGKAISAAEVQELKLQIRELERLVGKKTLENELLKEFLRSPSKAGSSICSLITKERDS